MVMDKRVSNFAAVRETMSLPVAPLQYLVNFPTQVIENIKIVFSTHDDLVKENLGLKSERLLLQSQLQRFVALERENAYLKSLLQSSRQVKGKTLIAEIMAVDSEPFVNQVIINKGKGDGVYTGQPVLDANGVMGQIIQVGPVTSRVLLVNDPHSGVAVQNTRSGLRAVALGDSYTGKLNLNFVPKTADVKIGDLFITSGLGGRFPEGYPVGKVVSVTQDPAKQFSTIILDPSAHLESSRQVLLIWYASNV